MRIFVALLLLLHGLIHLAGFIKSIKADAVPQLKENIPTFHGLLWLAAALLFISCAFMLFAHKIQWWMLGIPALIISQILVILYWQDAKLGTIANLFLLIAAVIAFSQWRFRETFLSDVHRSFQNERTNPERISAEDLAALPGVVRKYLEYTGHTEKVTMFKAVFEGEIRSGPNAKWMKFSATQYSWVNHPTRYFFMDATMKGIPVAGYHRFKDKQALMDIRALSLIPVSRQAGPEMNIAETVTHLNDMCLLAPASLTDKRISWIRADDHEAELAFSNEGIKVRAILQFDDQGALINFISDDRYMVTHEGALIKARWSTPVHSYKEDHGIRYPVSGEAIWETPEAKYTYVKMDILSVRINPVEAP